MQLTHKATFGKASLALVLLTAGSLTFACPAAAQHLYDASADFSTTSDPSPLDGGVWSYGVEATLGSTFSLYTSTGSGTGNGGGTVQGWVSAGGTPPVLGDNTSGTTYIDHTGGTTITVAPNQLYLHPGPNGQYSVLRFTAPVTSTFSFMGDFNAADSRPTTTDVHVLLDNVSIADGGINVNGGGNTASLSSPFLAMTKEDTLDFVVGDAGDFNYDSTGLYASVKDGASPVPEASTTVSFGLLLCLGLGGMAWSVRRQKAQAGE